VDEGNLSLEGCRHRHRVRTPPDVQPGTWIEQPWRTRLDLGAGRHAIRLYSWVAGLAVDCITIRHVGIDTPAPSVHVDA
jgi:hypothetical protein